MGVKVIRIDDINPNTHFKDFGYQVNILREFGFEFIAGVNLFSKTSNDGAIYPNLPLKNNHYHYFLKVNRVFTFYDLLECGLRREEIASHGLVHSDHSKMSKDAQELSILTSCSFLDTNKFIPPFNRFNEVTLDICNKNGIEIIGNSETVTWHSLETEEYSDHFSNWYYHPWRINAAQLEEKLSVCKKL